MHGKKKTEQIELTKMPKTVLIFSRRELQIRHDPLHSLSHNKEVNASLE